MLMKHKCQSLGTKDLCSGGLVHAGTHSHATYASFVILFGRSLEAAGEDARRSTEYQAFRQHVALARG